MSKEDIALLEEAEKAEKAEKEKAKKEKAEKKEDTKDSKKKTNQNENAKKDSTEVKPLTFDLENRFDRIVRLTVNSTTFGSINWKKIRLKYYWKELAAAHSYRIKKEKISLCAQVADWRK